MHLPIPNNNLEKRQVHSCSPEVVPWVLIWARMSCGSLHHASAVSALLCFATGTAPGEPIKIVRHAGDSCPDSNPHPNASLKAQHP